MSSGVCRIQALLDDMALTAQSRSTPDDQRIPSGKLKSTLLWLIRKMEQFEFFDCSSPA